MIGQANIQQPKHLKVLVHHLVQVVIFGLILGKHLQQVLLKVVVHNVLAQPNIGPKLKLQMKMKVVVHIDKASANLGLKLVRVVIFEKANVDLELSCLRQVKLILGKHLGLNIISYMSNFKAFFSLILGKHQLLLVVDQLLATF